MPAMKSSPTLPVQHVVEDDFEWVEVNGEHKPRPGMFVAQVVGRSMEPGIQDGAYCLFAAPVTRPARRRGVAASVRAMHRAAGARQRGLTHSSVHFFAMTTLHQLGDPGLDDDHRELERLIDAVAGAPADALLAAFDAMHAHASQHFATEDEELREMKDGNASCHLDEHAAVLKSFGEVREVIGPDPGSAVAERLIKSLVFGAAAMAVTSAR